MLNKETDLCKLIEAESNNAFHRSLPNFKRFINLCQSHNQIALKFATCKHCRRSCVMCPSCQPHLHYEKDEDLELKGLITIIKNIKEKYNLYHNTFIKEVIPNFLKTLTETVLSFVKELEKWDESISLVNSYLHFSNKKTKDLFASEIKDWNFRDIRCCDIFQLTQISKKVASENVEDYRTRINNELKVLLNKSLAADNLLPPPGKRNKLQEYVKIEGGIEEVRKRIQEENQEIYKKVPTKLLTVNLSQNILTIAYQQQQREQKQQGKPKITEKIEMENEEQQNIKLGFMVDQMGSFLGKWQPQYAKFIFKIPSTHLEFWEYFFSKLMTELKPKKVPFIRIYCLDPLRVYSILEELLQRQTDKQVKVLQGQNKNQQQNNQNQNELKKDNNIICYFNSFIFSFHTIQPI